MAKQLEYQTRSPYADEGRIPSMIPQLVKRPLLVRDEEFDLAVRARRGDEGARMKVIEANMRLVCNVARQFHSQLVPFEDLVQEGAIGLMKAVDRFDADKGCRFSTYAVYWIRQSIRKAVMARSRVIRLPAHAFEEKKQLARFREEFEGAHGRPPTQDEIASSCGYSLEKVLTLTGAEHDCLSLDSQGGESDFTALLPDLSCKSPEHAALETADRDTVRKLLTRLTARERFVLVRRLGLDGNAPPEDLRTLSHEMGLTCNAVSQIEAGALRTLRNLLEEGESLERSGQR